LSPSKASFLPRELPYLRLIEIITGLVRPVQQIRKPHRKTLRRPAVYSSNSFSQYIEIDTSVSTTMTYANKVDSLPTEFTITSSSLVSDIGLGRFSGELEAAK